MFFQFVVSSGKYAHFVHFYIENYLYAFVGKKHLVCLSLVLKCTFLVVTYHNRLEFGSGPVSTGLRSGATIHVCRAVDQSAKGKTDCPTSVFCGDSIQARNPRQFRSVFYKHANYQLISSPLGLVYSNNDVTFRNYRHISCTRELLY